MWRDVTGSLRRFREVRFDAQIRSRDLVSLYSSLCRTSTYSAHASQLIVTALSNLAAQPFIVRPTQQLCMHPRTCDFSSSPTNIPTPNELLSLAHRLKRYGISCFTSLHSASNALQFQNPMGLELRWLSSGRNLPHAYNWSTIPRSVKAMQVVDATRRESYILTRMLPDTKPHQAFLVTKMPHNTGAKL